MSNIVYLDLCCLKRSFDDGTVERVRREAEAVAAIMAMAASREVELVHSSVHDLENDRNPREERRLTVRLWLQAATISVETSPAITARATELSALGFGTLDALHLAFAEAAAARWFVTTDDRLVKLGLRHRENLIVEVVGPDQIRHEIEGRATS
ncbi:MAG TPA: PIN domain-containing protein [Thermoanaerobaculia bacterium]|nr:PIN domain-containing protein [Thermoanaerobaculia bacterium]